MPLDKIIGTIVIIILLGIIFTRRILISRNKKKQLKEHELKEKQLRERSIAAIRDRTIGGEKLIDYATYKISFQEFIKYSCIAGAAIFGTAYLFYGNVIIAGVAACFGTFYPKFQRKNLIEKRKDQLSLQFKEAISSLASSLAAGSQ
ncbi:type II secretion system F family protein [Paracerasibacillus soli]|uniref:Uncharacterized protein n=1 Tax=Paracerasibacillus soli TaxID=480284 RepID=A0ABU5CSY6_9BACI|nr:hypothetical protein [Virgibacillus soli]MDY0408535.1 hypothetical protein [Virgibacillus soli]